jgi:hypothetical protein
MSNRVKRNKKAEIKPVHEVGICWELNGDRGVLYVEPTLLGFGLVECDVTPLVATFPDDNEAQIYMANLMTMFAPASLTMEVCEVVTLPNRPGQSVTREVPPYPAGATN